MVVIHDTALLLLYCIIQGIDLTLLTSIVASVIDSGEDARLFAFDDNFFATLWWYDVFSDVMSKIQQKN